MSGVISPLIWVLSIVTLLITLLITTHEPPSTPQGSMSMLIFQGSFKGFRLKGPSTQIVKTVALK